VSADESLKGNKVPESSVAIAVSLVAAIAFYFSTKATLHDLDYTNQIASAFLHGQLGLQEKPPDWLNEMIPWEGRYYSAFPLGAVLSMLPVALLRNTRLIQTFPGHLLAALIAGLCVYFFFGLAKAFGAD
jgi:ABC-type Na+ efflux pump permease subunit